MAKLPVKVMASAALVSTLAATPVAADTVQAEEVAISSVILQTDSGMVRVTMEDFAYAMLPWGDKELRNYILDRKIAGVQLNEQVVVDYEDYINQLFTNMPTDPLELLEDMADDEAFHFTKEELASIQDLPADFAGSDLLQPHDIQGESHFSPFEGETVGPVEGIVTHLLDKQYFPKGFYIHATDEDGNINTSEGVFVKTDETPEVGSVVEVTGLVEERKPSLPSYMSTEFELTTTQIAASDVTVTGTADLPDTTELGKDRKQPIEFIDNDGLESFDAEEDAIDFYESLEGMRVEVPKPTVVGPINYDEITVVPGKVKEDRTQSGGLLLTPDDYNPERLIIDVEDYASTATFPATVGDKFKGDITGIMDYDYSNFQLIATEELPELKQNKYEPETTELTGESHKLNVATYNVENFSPDDAGEKANRIAETITQNLKKPDIISLVEVQDNDGANDSGVTAADESAQVLIDAIEQTGGPTYEYVEIEPVNNEEGGQPGGNIRVGFLYNPDRVSLKDAAPKGGSEEAVGYENDDLTLNPGRIAPTNEAFEDSRIPLAAEFTFQGEDVIVVANHFNSKGGDDALYGLRQPAERGSEVQRHKIAEVVNGFVDDIMTQDPDANVVVMGDLNDFQFSETLDILKGDVLTNKVDSLPMDEQYTYVFQGNSQALDHILVNNELAASTAIDIVHINAEFSQVEGQASDHDPLLAKIDFGFDPLSKEEAVEVNKESLTLGFSGGDDTTAVTRNLKLPEEGTDGVKISWKSSNSKVIDKDGTVTRPSADAEDETVTLTATLKKGKERATKTFDVTVVKEVGQLSIAEARVLENDADVIISGTITAVDGKNLYVQDETAGIVVRDWSGEFAGEPGDVIEVQGTKGSFNGLDQVEVEDAANISIIKEDTIPEPKEITADQLNEEHEGMLVQITDVSVTGDAGYGEFGAEDSQQTSFIVDNELIDGSVAIGESYESITGVVVYSFGAYKLAPRTTEDVQ
ncbi:endonuclease/exonuclease/phosphatase family protein [Halobacillus litoralis]|uniref:immunoglobulin-like domain-containing protein n=1 Tax=Halobacillus litoralis TaxID=45668 RepID=UPI001CD1CEC3|nr:immunoglobulin-like domain-containing protein [Halobacillus litoralis]MCA0970955.1 endonuclease/exonuclease/phosphatase family protein [Halobacillus litoralis]